VRNPSVVGVSGCGYTCVDRPVDDQHGCLNAVSVVCCQVEVPATSCVLVKRSPTDCGASLCMF
jgi:hypothetical protein